MPYAEKLQSIQALHGRLAARRPEGCVIVHTHGTFDLLHIGAVRHLEQARQLGGVLVVTITPDAALTLAGMRPLFNQDLRAEALAALSCVDYVAVAGGGSSTDAIQSICPHIYVPWAENDPG